MSIAAFWQDHALASPLPLAAMPDLARDGYLTGVVVAPRPIPSLHWLAVLLGSNDLMPRDAGQLRAARDAVMARHATLAAEIDRHLARLERDRICDYRPAFLTGEGNPAHAAVRRWAGGFAAAMALVPDAWSALLEDARTQVLLLGAIRADTDAGEAPEVPEIDENRSLRTADISVFTSKEVHEAGKTHLNLVVSDTITWEQSAAYILDHHPAVRSFVKNFGLNFTIPYLHNGKPSDYLPDFVVRLEAEDVLYSIVEIKGCRLGRYSGDKGSGCTPLVCGHQCSPAFRQVGLCADQPITRPVALS
jgi:uncharacterized protein